MRVHGIARYPHIANPSAPKGSDKKKHSVSILIPKTDPQCAMIQAEVEAAKANGFPSGFPQNATTCWEDLALTDPANIAVANYMSLKSSTNVDNGMPRIVDANIQPILDPAIDSNMIGMMIYVDVGVASFDHVSKGVKAYLNGVMVTQQAGAIPKESLSNKPDAKSMFGDVAPFDLAAPKLNIAPAPQPLAPPPLPDTAVHQMTAKANGATYESMIQAGWTDVTMVEQGMMIPPVATSFA